MANDPVASDAIDQYFNTAAPLLDCGQQAKITAAVMELLRLTSGAAVVAGSDPKLARIGLIDLVGLLCGIDWEQIPFSITQTALKAPPPNCDLVTALKTFVNVAELEPQAATQEVLKSLLVATNGVEPSAAPTAPIAPAKKAPRLSTTNDIAKVFDRGQFRPDSAAPAIELLNWQSELSTGGLGPQLWAVSLEETPERVKILLETGETIWVPSNTFLLAKTTDPQDYEAVSLSLLAAARVYLPWQFLVDPPIPEAQFDRRFGQFTKPLFACPYGVDLVEPLANVFAEPHKCPQGNAVAVTLSVDGTPYFATLEARTSTSGPYVTAKLLDASENVIMRLDTPRQFSPCGVYLFPLQDQAIALVIR